MRSTTDAANLIWVGAIMHLTGKSSGVMLSLGRDEILVRM